MKTERNELIDVIKGVAIILVVMGHCIQYGSGYDWMTSGVFFDNYLFKTIYSFHMPLFMLVSGYLFWYSIEKRVLWDNIKQRIISIILPICTWSFLSNLVLLYKQGATLEFIPYMKQYIRYTIGEFWFLWAIFYCSLVVILVNRFGKDKVWIYVMGLVVSFFISDSFNSYYYKYMYPYFIIGYLFNKYKGFNWKKYDKWMNWGIVIFVYIILLGLFQRETYIYVSRYRVWGHEKPFWMLYLDFVRFAAGMLGSVLLIKTIMVCFYSLSKNFIAIIVKLGQNSLGIYIVSGYLFSNVLAPLCYHFKTINYFLMIIEVTVITLVSYIFTRLIQKQSILNLFLLGGRKTGMRK